jgi:hypothetical protein
MVSMRGGKFQMISVPLLTKLSRYDTILMFSNLGRLYEEKKYIKSDTVSYGTQ